MSVYASTYNPNSTPSSSSHQHTDSQTLLPKTNQKSDPTQQQQQDPHDKTYAPPIITPHRLRSHLLVHNLKASGILPYTSNADEGRPPQLKHSARGLEAIGFDENASMYSCFRGEGATWKSGEGEGGGKEKKELGRKRSFLKKLVGKGEGKGEKL